jgi:hypothetical protein
VKILITLSVPDDKVDPRFTEHLRYYINQTRVLGCTIDSMFQIESVSD